MLFNSSLASRYRFEEQFFRVTQSTRDDRIPSTRLQALVYNMRMLRIE